MGKYSFVTSEKSNRYLKLLEHGIQKIKRISFDDIEKYFRANKCALRMSNVGSPIMYQSVSQMPSSEKMKTTWKPRNERERKKFEFIKLDIKTALLISKNGIPLCKAYDKISELIGEVINFKQLGFRTFTDFLCQMDDILQVRRCKKGNLFIFFKGSPDEETEHLRSLVEGQKPNSGKEFTANLTNTTEQPIDVLRETLPQEQDLCAPPSLSGPEGISDDYLEKASTVASTSNSNSENVKIDFGGRGGYSPHYIGRGRGWCAKAFGRASSRLREQQNTQIRVPAFGHSRGTTTTISNPEFKFKVPFSPPPAPVRIAMEVDESVVSNFEEKIAPFSVIQIPTGGGSSLNNRWGGDSGFHTPSHFSTRSPSSVSEASVVTSWSSGPQVRVHEKQPQRSKHFYQQIQLSENPCEATLVGVDGFGFFILNIEDPNLNYDYHGFQKFLCDFYGMEKVRQLYKTTKAELIVGQMVVSFAEGTFIRSIIYEIDSDQVKVFGLDNREFYFVDFNNIYEITDCFFQKPAQAFICSLDGLDKSMMTTDIRDIFQVISFGQQIKPNVIVKQKRPLGIFKAPVVSISLCLTAPIICAGRQVMLDSVDLLKLLLVCGGQRFTQPTSDSVVLTERQSGLLEILQEKNYFPSN